MSDDAAQEKTEEPSGKRIDEFREEGQIARSPEFTSLIVLGSAVIGLLFFGSRLIHQFAVGTIGAFQYHAGHPLANFVSWFRIFAGPIVKTFAGFLGVVFAIVLVSSLSETGIIFSWKSLEPKFEPLNPLGGIQKLFQSRKLVEFVKNLLKLICISWIAFYVLTSHLNEIVLSSTLSLLAGFHWGVGLLKTISIRIGIFLAAISLLDYAYQKYSLYKKMMMSRQELKEEMKESQISEHVRGKVRQIQKERAKRVIQKEVPKADVIVTNPTHFAVAVRYDRSVDRAPRVVAKGTDRLAALIRVLATENKVPVYEYPELARGLYKKVRVGQSIPIELYESVARVLAYIYQIHQQRRLFGSRGAVY